MRHAVHVALIMFGKRQLSVSIGPPDGLRKGAGTHRLTFPIEVDGRTTIGTGVPVTIYGEAWLGPYEDWLGMVFADTPVIVLESGPSTASLVLSLTDEQLAVVEQRRAGSDLQLRLKVQFLLGYDPVLQDKSVDDRWPSKYVEQSVSVQSEAWVRLLKQASAGMSLAIVVPVPLDASTAAHVGSHLREAIRKVNNSEYPDAVIDARKAIEAMDAVVHWKSENVVVRVKRDERSLEERLTMLRHALYGVASVAAHSDEVASTFTWDREKALAVIAGVSSLAACLPKEAAS